MKKKIPATELICYCFLTNLVISFIVHKLNYLIKNVSLMQYKNFVPIYPYLISEGDEIVRACDRHWDETVTLTKHVTWMYKSIDSIFACINTCENGLSNFSPNLRVVSLKLLELTQFAWPNLSIYFNFSCVVPRDDVIKKTRFLLRPSVIILPWI